LSIVSSCALMSSNETKMSDGHRHRALLEAKRF
jgi:hypothetical protein